MTSELLLNLGISENLNFLPALCVCTCLSHPNFNTYVNYVPEKLKAPEHTEMVWPWGE